MQTKKYWLASVDGILLALLRYLASEYSFSIYVDNDRIIEQCFGAYLGAVIIGALLFAVILFRISPAKELAIEEVTALSIFFAVSILLTMLTGYGVTLLPNRAIENVDGLLGLVLDVFFVIATLGSRLVMVLIRFLISGLRHMWNTHRQGRNFS